MHPKTPANEKILDVLLLFRQPNRELMIDDITAALAIPKSTAYRYTKTLTDKGFLDKGTAPGVYRLGRVFLELSQAAFASSRDLHRAALPHMVTVADATGESVSLMQLLNRRAVCIESIPGTYALRVAIQRGRAQQLHAGASSRLLLAYQAESAWEGLLDFPLERFTASTMTEAEALFANLRDVRRRGYAFSDGEIDIGAYALAVPLFDRFGTVIAALSLEAPASRITPTLADDYRARLQAAAEAVQASLT